MAKYRPNEFEFRRYMKSDDIGRFIKDEAERLAAHLRVTAPRQTGAYASRFRVETGLDLRRRDRSAAFVINDSDYATALEVGSWVIKNPPRPMTRVLDAFPGRLV